MPMKPVGRDSAAVGAKKKVTNQKPMPCKKQVANNQAKPSRTQTHTVVETWNRLFASALVAIQMAQSKFPDVNVNEKRGNGK